MFKKQKHFSKAFSLVELVVAVSLLSIVVFTAVSLEFSFRRLNLGIDIKTSLINDLVYAKEMIKREALLATGDAVNNILPFEWNKTAGCNGDRYLRIRVDSNQPLPDGVWNDTNDRISTFYWRGGEDENCGPDNCKNRYDLCYRACENCGYEVVISNVTNFDVLVGTAGDIRRISVLLQNMKDPTAIRNDLSNPQQGVRFGITARQCPPFRF